MPCPTGDDEHIALLPLEAGTVDNGRAAPLEGVIDGTADVPMGLCLYAWSEHLNPGCERWHDWATSLWINVFQRHIIERAGIHLGQIGERTLSVGPLVSVHRWMLNDSFLPGR